MRRSKAEKTFGKKLRAQLDEKQNDTVKIPAVIGDGSGGVKVTGAKNFVYVTVGNHIHVAYNDRVPAKHGLKIWVGYDPIDADDGKPKKYQVLSSRTDTPLGEDEVGGVPPHASTHEWMSSDPLNVHLRAITLLKLGISKVGGMSVMLFRGNVQKADGEWVNVTTQNIDLTAYIPSATGKAAYVLITIDADGLPKETKGNEVDVTALALTDIPANPAGTLFTCGAVRVYYGQTAVHEAPSNTDFVDLRFTDYNAGGEVADGGTGTFLFGVDGRLAIADNAAVPLVISTNANISSWTMYVEDLGTAGATAVDVILHRTGETDASIFTTPPEIAHDAASNLLDITPAVTEFLAGDVLTLNIESTATTASGLVLVAAPVSGGDLVVADDDTEVDHVSRIVFDGFNVSDEGGGEAKIKSLPVEVLNVAAGAATTSSSSYADHNSSASKVEFTKAFDATYLLIRVDFAMYSTEVNTSGKIGVSIDGTDYDVMTVYINPVSVHMATSGVVKIADIDKGTYDIAIRWKRVSGSGVLTTNNDDTICLQVMETN